MHKALVIDDRKDSFDFLSSALKNYNLTWLSDSSKIAIIQDFEIFDFFIIDYDMPTMNGIEVIEFLNKIDYKNRPRFIFSANSQQYIKEKFLELGVLDYLSPTMSPKEINMRLNNLLNGVGVIQIGSLTTFDSFNTIKINNTVISLTKNERDLLEFIIKNSEKNLSTALILDKLWHGKMNLKTFNAHFSNLRKKLEGWDHNIFRQKNTGTIKVLRWKN